jgi:hypothetical protein
MMYMRSRVPVTNEDEKANLKRSLRRTSLGRTLTMWPIQHAPHPQGKAVRSA